MKFIEHYHPSISIRNQTELISVIIAAYNIEDYIRRGIDSVRSQTYGNLDIVVVDDGSTDATGAICDRLAAKDGRIRVIHKKNGGLSEARNVGISQARGSYIGFVDGDDWIDPDMYEKMLGAMKEQDAEAAVCRYRRIYTDRIDDQSGEGAVLFEGQEALQYYVQETPVYDMQNAAWNKLYKKEVLAGIEFPVGKWYEDILFTTKALARVKRCIYLDSACYNYIIDRKGSIMNAQINSRTFTDQIPAYYEKTAFLGSIGRDDLADIHDYFFYKRLLQFYVQVHEADMPERDSYLEQLTQIIRDNREHYSRVYSCAAADPRDYRKMKLFLRSPRRYLRRVRLEERVIVPCKASVKAVLRKMRLLSE